MPRTIRTPLRSPARERWLKCAAKLLAPLLLPDTLPPLVIRTDVNIKSGLGVPASGICWDDMSVRIDLDAELVEPTQILAILLHELVHAVVGPQLGHNGAYRPLFRRVGFVGLPTGYDTSESLLDDLVRISNKLGPYPIR